MNLIAAKMLEYFCIDGDQSFNGFMPGVKLAVAFLDTTCGLPDQHQRQQSLKDLKSILAAAEDRHALLGWAKGWYG